MSNKGKLIAWGDDGARQITDVPPSNDRVGISRRRRHFVKIAPGGNRQSLAIRNDGSLALWGGVGLGLGKAVPALPNLANEIFVDAALGLMHLIAIRADGSIWTGGKFVTPTNPVKPSFTLKATAVAAAADHWLAIDAKDQTLVQWPTPAPGRVAPPKGKFIKVGARNDYSIALRDDHRLFAWGGTAFPATGVPSSGGGGSSGPIDLNVKTFLQDWEYDGEGHFFVHGKFDFPIPDVPPHIKVKPSGDMIVDIAAGVIQKNRGGIPHILALHANGTVTGWGPQKGLETKFPSGVRFKEIAAGLAYSIAIDDKGKLYHRGPPGPLATVPTGCFSSIGAGVVHAAAIFAK